jgi:uncharacterized protein (TIGR03437 family)
MARSNARTFARLLQFLRPYRWSLGVSALLAILSQGAAIGVLVLTGFVVDELSGGRDPRRLTFLILAILGVGVVKALLMLGPPYTAPLASGNNLKIRIGGVQAAVQFAGLNCRRLTQFNVVVPTLSDGEHLVEVSVWGVDVPTTQYLAVKQ